MMYRYKTPRTFTRPGLVMEFLNLKRSWFDMPVARMYGKYGMCHSHLMHWAANGEFIKSKDLHLQYLEIEFNKYLEDFCAVGS